MSGKQEGPETGPSGVAPSNAAGIEPVAAALALGAASHNQRVAAKAEAYLEAQQRLSELQIARLQVQDKHFHEEAVLELSHMRLRRFSDLAKAAFEFSIGLLALALVGAFALMVWNAAHSDGLIVESFGVPPDLAARGLTGQVIAGQLTDKLSQLQADTDSNRAPRSYSNDWGNDIKVEIPETGVSIGEAYRFLRRWLGHETHVGGDVWRTQTGLAIAARVNGGGGAITGTEADLDGLIQKAAEDIFNRTQPYRYAVYLDRHGRTAEAIVHRAKLTATTDENERAWAYFAAAVNAMGTAAPAELERLLKLAAPHGPALALGNLGILEEQLGRMELARSYHEQADARMRDGGGDINPDSRAGIASGYVTALLRFRSDNRAALQELEKGIGERARSLTNPAYGLAQMQLLDHDGKAARRTMESAMAQVQTATSNVTGANIHVRFQTQMAIARAAENWPAALSLAQAMTAALRSYPGQVALILTADDPQTAIAEARLRKFADAERRVSHMPGDCYPCLRARAAVADLQRQPARADFWFARAVASNPSFPQAEEEWGRVLLARGQPDVAIAKFKLSNAKAPHFADPLEGWGEALMARNKSHLALEKFTEADKYAPNWARLHLKWGEALAYSGNKEEAAKQFARAAQLDLTPSEKSELARHP